MDTSTILNIGILLNVMALTALTVWIYRLYRTIDCIHRANHELGSFLYDATFIGVEDSEEHEDEIGNTDDEIERWDNEGGVNNP